MLVKELNVKSSFKDFSKAVAIDLYFLSWDILKPTENGGFVLLNILNCILTLGKIGYVHVGKDPLMVIEMTFVICKINSSNDSVSIIKVCYHWGKFFLWKDSY